MAEQFRLGTKVKTPLRTFRWKSNSSFSEVTRRETFWIIKSNVRLQTSLDFMKLLYIWGLLTPKEQQIILDHPGTLADPIFRALAVAKVQTKIPLEDLVDNLEKFCSLLGRKNNFRKSLVSQWSGNIAIEIKEKDFPIRSAKKFSGYVRNSSSVGSKRMSKFTFEPIPEKFSPERFEEYEFIYEAITVGEVVSRSGALTVTLKRILRRSKRKSNE